MAALLKQMTNYIIVCDCKDMPQFAQEAFSILFPEKPSPILTRKRDIPSLLLDFEGTDFGDYLNALYQNKEKYAYSFVVDDGGKIINLYDLKKGVKVQ